MTRFELVAFPLPRGCATPAPHGHVILLTGGLWITCTVMGGEHWNNRKSQRYRFCLGLNSNNLGFSSKTDPEGWIDSRLFLAWTRPEKQNRPFWERFWYG